MKELSIEEKAKRYDEAINAIKKLKENHPTALVIKDWIKENFPELTESEDERIRKRLLELFENHYSNEWYGLDVKKVIAWLEKQGQTEYDKDMLGAIEYCKKNNRPLEKEHIAWLKNQGEQKPEGKTALEAIKEEKVDNANKVEPKFHEGDWVVYKNDICQIVKRKEGCNKLVTNFGIEKEFVNERNLSTAWLWTIQDANDGDVLVDKNGCINIYKEPCDKTFYYSHGYCYYPNHGYMYEKDGKFVAVQTAIKIEDANPATKEQRDTLMKAMADAGYTFDFEKKELKKVEQKHAAWSEEDEKLLDNTIRFIENCVAATSPSLRTYNPILTGKEIPFLKSLKDRVQPQSTWKPSEEQIECLSDAIEHYNSLGYPATTLKELLNNLLKLREE